MQVMISKKPMLQVDIQWKRAAKVDIAGAIIGAISGGIKAGVATGGTGIVAGAISKAVEGALVGSAGSVILDILDSWW